MPTENQLMLEKLQNLHDAYHGEIARIQTARADLPGAMNSLFYVDEASGLAGNDGSAEAPLPSVDAALDAVRDGQNVEIRLLSNATWARRHWRRSLGVFLTGWSATQNETTRRALTMAAEAINMSGNAPGISGSGLMTLSFNNIGLRLSQNTGTVSESHFKSHFTALGFYSSSITGSGGTSYLTEASSGSFSVGLHTTTVTSMAGRWVSGFASGTTLTADKCGGIIDPAISN